MDGLGFVLAGLVLAIVAVPIGVLSLRLAVGLAGLGVLTAVAPDAAEEIATGPLQGAAQTGGLGVGSGLVRSLPEDTPIPLRLELVYNYEEMLASVLGVTVIGYLFADGREPTLAIKAHDPVVVAPRAEVVLDLKAVYDDLRLPRFTWGATAGMFALTSAPTTRLHLDTSGIAPGRTMPTTVSVTAIDADNL